MNSRTSAEEKPKKQWRLVRWFPELSEDQHRKLRMFHVELIHFNGRMNLISNRSEKEADLVHFADCLLASQSILSSTSKQEIFDIGSGNGLPGIIMAILDPSRKIIMVDKDARKIEFLKHVIGRLNLVNTLAIHARLEDLPDGSVHCAVSRGFASIGKSLVVCRRVAADDMEYFHLKSDGWVKEAAEIPPQICRFWEPKLVAKYDLPENYGYMCLVVTNKVAGQQI